MSSRGLAFTVVSGFLFVCFKLFCVLKNFHNKQAPGKLSSPGSMTDGNSAAYKGHPVPLMCDTLVFTRCVTIQATFAAFISAMPRVLKTTVRVERGEVPLCSPDRTGGRRLTPPDSDPPPCLSSEVGAFYKDAELMGVSFQPEVTHWLCPTQGPVPTAPPRKDRNLSLTRI